MATQFKTGMTHALIRLNKCKFLQNMKIVSCNVGKSCIIMLGKIDRNGSESCLDGLIRNTAPIQR